MIVKGILLMIKNDKKLATFHFDAIELVNIALLERD